VAVAQRVRWPFVGRGIDLEDLEALLDDRDVRAVVLTGDAGVGKTRLAQEFMAVAADRGHATALAFASASAATVPLSTLGTFIPTRLQGLPPAKLFAQVQDLVRESSADRRLVLLVDDVDLLDTVSLALVASLVDAGLALLVATLRRGASAPDVVERWWRSGGGVQREVGQLTPVQVDGLLHLALSGPLEVATRQAFLERSGGNPLYLRELILGALEARALAPRDGTWVLTGTLAASSGLAAVVQARLAELSEPERAAMNLLALCQPLGLDSMLAQHAAEVVEQLEVRGLVVVSVSERRTEVSITHPLQAEVIREGMPLLRRRALLLEQVERTETCGARRRDDALRLAVWRLDATGTADVDLLLRAALLAKYGHDMTLVGRLARAALVLEPHPTASALLAESLAETGHPEAAEAIYGEAAANADGVTGTLLTLPRAANLYFSLAQPDRSLELLDEAFSRPTGITGIDIAVQLARATVLAFSGDARDALEQFEQLQLDDPGLQMLRSWGMVTALVQSGRLEEARKISLSAETSFSRLQDRVGLPHESAILITHAGVAMAMGELDEVDRLADRALELAQASGTTSQLPWGHWLLARTAQLRGQGQDSYEHARAAASAAATIGSVLAERIATSGMAHALAMGGRTAEAQEIAGGLEDVAFHTGDFARSRAWVEACSGDLAGARRLLLDAADLAAEQGRINSALDHAYDAVRLGDRGMALRVVELAARVQGPFAAARANAAAAVTAADAAALLSAGREFEQLGMALHAAECCVFAANQYRKDGDRRGAAAAQTRSAELVAPLGGSRTPALASGTAATPLTPRELEIALQAAAGKSSKEIADGLVLSVRTVDNHLQNIYSKLGASGRAELAARLAVRDGRR
jgi:DNA-binding CsgD family transcriptional regulator